VSIAPDLAPGAPTIDLDAPPAPAASAELRGPDAGKKKPKPHRPVWRGYAKPTATDNSKSPYGRFE
jgi:hypothetical protein